MDYPMILLPWITLFVYVTPLRSMDDESLVAKKVYRDPAQEVTLVCRTDSDRVIWYQEGRPIMSYANGKSRNLIMNEDFQMIHQFEQERDLHIKDLDQSVAGVYSCEFGSETFERYQLIVNYAATIYAHSGSVEPREFSTVGLWCNASGEPKPEITWYLVEENIEHFIDITGPYLEIRNITRGCTSMYRCKGENSLNIGGPVSADITVTTRYIPEVDISLDEPEENVENFVFDNTSLTYYVDFTLPIQTRRIKLTCYYAASPAGAVSWIVGQQVIGTKQPGDPKIDKSAWQDSYAYELYQNKPGELELHIKPDKNDLIFALPYKCSSQNDDGEDHCSVQFKNVVSS